jgi:hypothetical protein
VELSGQFNAPDALPQGKEHIESAAGGGGYQNRSGRRFGEEINVLPLPEIEGRSIGLPASSVVTVPTGLSRLPSLIATFRFSVFVLSSDLLQLVVS